MGEHQRNPLEIAVLSHFHKMINELFLLKEAFGPLSGVVEFFLSKCRLGGWLGPLEQLKLLISVHVLPSRPLNELLIVDFASLGNLKICESFLSRCDGDLRVVQLCKDLTRVIISSTL